MAKVRTLDISTLGNIDLKFARQIKPISAKQFEMLPLDKQEAFRTLFDQAYTIWEKQDLYENVQTYGSAKPATELFDLLEPYKTRDFANYPAPLKEMLLKLYSQEDSTNAKKFDFLLWFVDKKYLFDAKLPKEIQNFIGQVYEVNIDYLSNNQLYLLVRNVNRLYENNTGFASMSPEVQNFVRQCYIHCESQQQIMLNNKSMRALFLKNGYELNYAFNDFNRAFAGLRKTDYTSEFSNPAQKLKLGYMIDYENMQNNFLSTFKPNCNIELLGSDVAYNLGLQTIYVLEDDFYRYNDESALPSHIEYFQDEYGYRRSLYKPTERDYKRTIGVALANEFSDMLNFDIAQVLSKNELLGQLDQQSAIKDFINLYNKNFSTKNINLFKRIVKSSIAKREDFGKQLYSTAAGLLDSSNISGYYKDIEIENVEPEDYEIEYREEESSKSGKQYIKNRMQELEERFVEHPNDLEAVQEYMDLEDQLRSTQEGEKEDIEDNDYYDEHDSLDNDTNDSTENDMRERLQELDEILMKDPKNWQAMQEYYDIEDKLKNLEEQKEME